MEAWVCPLLSFSFQSEQRHFDASHSLHRSPITASLSEAIFSHALRRLRRRFLHLFIFRLLPSLHPPTEPRQLTASLDSTFHTRVLTAPHVAAGRKTPDHSALLADISPRLHFIDTDWLPFVRRRTSHHLGAASPAVPRTRCAPDGGGGLRRRASKMRKSDVVPPFASGRAMETDKDVAEPAGLQTAVEALVEACCVDRQG